MDDPLGRAPDGKMVEYSRDERSGEGFVGESSRVEVVSVVRSTLIRRRAAWRDLYFAAARVSSWPLGSIRNHRGEHQEDFQELRRALDALDETELGEDPST